MGFKDFVLSKFDELKTKFKLKNEQYQGSNADQLANFRIGARIKYGDASYQHMYECAKDYARKHIAFIETHNIEADHIEESLGDIAVYSIIMMYMKACNEAEQAMLMERDERKAEAR